MKIRLLGYINSFLLREWGFWTVIFSTILIGAYLYDSSYSLKPFENIEASESNPTIFTLEFANRMETDSIIKSWEKQSINFGGFAPQDNRGSKIKIAKIIIFCDFAFILFYTVLLFLLLNRTFRFYDLRFFGFGFHNWFSLYRETLFFIFVFLIGTLDIIENIIMLLNLNNRGFLDCLISIKICCVKMKFMSISITILIIIFVNFNKIIYSFLLDPNSYMKKITKPFSLEN